MVRVHLLSLTPYPNNNLTTKSSVVFYRLYLITKILKVVTFSEWISYILEPSNVTCKGPSVMVNENEKKSDRRRV